MYTFMAAIIVEDYIYNEAGKLTISQSIYEEIK